MTTIKVTDKNIKAMSEVERQELGDKGLTTSNIYKICNMPLATVRQMVEDEPKLKKRLKTYCYGGTALHFALINPNIEVFKYMASIYQREGIDLDMRVDRYRKIGKPETVIMEGYTLLNIALSSAELDKIELVSSLGIDELCIPKLPQLYRSYEVSNEVREDSNILYYCLYLALKENKNFASLEEKANFFINFAGSFDSIENLIDTNIIATKPDKNNYNNYPTMKLISSYLLIFNKNSYESKTFKEKVLPLLFKSVCDLCTSSQTLFNRNMLTEISTPVIKYLDAPQKYYQHLQKTISQYKLHFSDKDEVINNLGVAGEKQMLSKSIESKTSSVSKFKL